MEWKVYESHLKVVGHTEVKCGLKKSKLEATKEYKCDKLNIWQVTKR
jgi:hypothetical protein